MNQNDRAILIANKTKSIRNKIEPYILALALIALILKTQHVMGMSFILITTLSYLSMSSFIGSYGTLDNENSESRALERFLKYLNGWGLSIQYIGILFTVQHWPGNKSMLLPGTIIVLLSIMFEYIKKLPNEKLILRIVLAAIGLAFLFATQQQLYDLGIIRRIVAEPIN